MFAAAVMFCLVSQSGTELRIWVLLAITETFLELAVSACEENVIQQKQKEPPLHIILI